MKVVVAALSLILGATALQAQPREADVVRVERHFAQLHQIGRFNGLILVSSANLGMHQQTYGFGDFEQRTPITPESIFRLGSLSKPVTSSVVLRSVADGRLALHDRLCDRVDFCLPAWSGVTLEQLLSHSSGIPDHFGDLKAVPVGETVAEIARAMAGVDPAETLKFEPGSAYEYSNFNYVLAAAMLEKAEGRTWREAVRDVASKVGASTLDYDDVYAIVPRRVRGYDRGEDGKIRNIDYDDHAAYAAGGLMATAADFLRWAEAVLEGDLLPARLRDEMLTPRHGNYALGWQIRRFHDRQMYNHTGGIDGFATHIAHYPDEDVTILVFTNVESDPAMLFACDAAAILFDVAAARELPAEQFEDLEPRARCGLTG